MTLPNGVSMVEHCILSIHRCNCGFLTIEGHGWVRYWRGRIMGGRCTGLPEYLLMLSHWEQTGF